MPGIKRKLGMAVKVLRPFSFFSSHSFPPSFLSSFLKQRNKKQLSETLDNLLNSLRLLFFHVKWAQ